MIILLGPEGQKKNTEKPKTGREKSNLSPEEEKGKSQLLPEVSKRKPRLRIWCKHIGGLDAHSDRPDRVGHRESAMHDRAILITPLGEQLPRPCHKPLSNWAPNESKLTLINFSL